MNNKPYIQVQTKKGKLIHDSYKVAFANLHNHYETCDPLAVVAAMIPEESVEEVIEKRCYIETNGTLTKGAVIVDWFERYPMIRPRKPVKIVTKINSRLLIDLMTESVLS